MAQIILNLPDEHADHVRTAARRRLDGVFPRITKAVGEGKEMDVVESDNPDADATTIYLQDLLDDFCGTASIEHCDATTKDPGTNDEARSAALLVKFKAEQAATERRAARVQRAIPTS